MTINWVETILDATDPGAAWADIFDKMKDLAMSTASPSELHNQTIIPDRLLSEAAWELWSAYPDSAPLTSRAIKDWCDGDSAIGRAVLVLDALSLRQLPFILGGAEQRGIKDVKVGVTGSEVPSDTDHFAKALGATSRGSLSNNGATKAFIPFARSCETQVLGIPFADCLGAVPNCPNVFIWHSWLDDLIHVQHRLPDQIHRQSENELQGDGFWKFVDKLRQGRRLVITADHGYATAGDFSSGETDPEATKVLKDNFGASRYKKKQKDLKTRFMPPIILEKDEFLVVMGQKKWTVQGGFPKVCHGGLSLLEVAVPFIELPPL